jgi:hypothetical protein
MKLNTFRGLIAALGLTMLSACGGGNDTAPVSEQSPQLPSKAATAGDCANSACSPPVIDGLAEEFRSRALARKHEAEDEAVPRYPRVPDSAANGPDPDPRP